MNQDSLLPEAFEDDDDILQYEKERAEVAQRGDVEDATYQCRLEKISHNTFSKNNLRLLKMMFRIMSGPHKKICLFINQEFQLSTVGFLTEFMEGLFGIKASKDENEPWLRDRLRESRMHIGKFFEVKQTTNGIYHNYEVIRPIPIAEGAATAAVEEIPDPETNTGVEAGTENQSAANPGVETETGPRAPAPPKQPASTGKRRQSVEEIPDPEAGTATSDDVPPDDAYADDNCGDNQLPPGDDIPF